MLYFRYFSLYGKQNIAVFRNALELYCQLLSYRSNSIKAVSNGATRYVSNGAARSVSNGAKLDLL